jgi:phosphoglycolate/pyridoxal phosphate phosphatase family enzyme
MSVLSRATQELTPERASLLRKDVDTVVFDCDGVLWRSGTAIPGAPEALKAIAASGIRCLFVSNNSTLSRADYVQKFDRLGFSGVNSDDIVSTSSAAGVWLRKRFLGQTQGESSTGGADERRPKVFVCGESGLVAEVTAAGFDVVPPPPSDLTVKEIEAIQVDKDIVAVVCGFDRAMSYAKLTYAHLCLVEIPNCTFLASNLDTTFPVSEGRMVPGSGATTAGLMASTGRHPDGIVGKPEVFIMEECILAGGGSSDTLDPARTLMVGDRLNTDIAFGRKCGLRTLLVLTGVSQLSDLPDASDLETPDLWAASVADLAA